MLKNISKKYRIHIALLAFASVALPQDASATRVTIPLPTPEFDEQPTTARLQLATSSKPRATTTGDDDDAVNDSTNSGSPVADALFISTRSPKNNRITVDVGDWGQITWNISDARASEISDAKAIGNDAPDSSSRSIFNRLVFTEPQEENHHLTLKGYCALSHKEMLTYTCTCTLPEDWTRLSFDPKEQRVSYEIPDSPDNFEHPDSVALSGNTVCLFPSSEPDVSGGSGGLLASTAGKTLNSATSENTGWGWGGWFGGLWSSGDNETMPKFTISAVSASASANNSSALPQALPSAPQSDASARTWLQWVVSTVAVATTSAGSTNTPVPPQQPPAVHDSANQQAHD